METRTNRSYRLRGSRVTAAQRSALNRLWPIYGVVEFPSDPSLLFKNSNPIILEIGFGMGEATARIAEEMPDTNFIAVDVHFPGVGKLLARIEDEAITNIRIVEGDVHDLLEGPMVNGSLAGIHIFFPDPWPKKRHFKRRILNQEFLTLIQPKIKSGGFIHIATDWVPYAEWIEEVFAGSKLFSGGKIERPHWRPMTRFEGQGITKEHAVTDFRYKKI